MSDDKIALPAADPRQNAIPPEEMQPIDGEDPFTLFAEYFKEAQTKEVNDPNAFALATAGKDAFPNVRMLLLKGFDASGFTFYTNTESAKGRELTENPRAAMCFHWKSLLRQVRIRGPIETVTATEADAYFNSRDRKSRIGAHVSAQSRPLESRATLIKEAAFKTAKFAVGAVPRPDYWSGFRLIPEEIEFWQNGAFRLHDRLLFKRETTDAVWKKTRLYP